MNKKILIFGLPLLAVGLVIAAVVYFQSVEVTASVLEPLSSSDVVLSLSGVAGSSVTGQVLVDNAGPVQYNVEFEWSETANNYVLESDKIVWDLDDDGEGEDTERGYLDSDFETGKDTIRILTEGLTLGDLDSIDFEQYVTAGYPVSVNILLDINEDETFTSKKDLTTGYLTNGEDDVLKIEWAYNEATAGYPDAYMEEDEYDKWVRVFPNNALIDGTTNAWLYSVIPGGADIVNNTLENWKLGINRGTSCYYVKEPYVGDGTPNFHKEYCDSININSSTIVYGIEIESLGWIAASGSKVRDIKVNDVKVADGVLYEVTFPTNQTVDIEGTSFDVTIEYLSDSPTGELEGTISLSRA